MLSALDEQHVMADEDSFGRGPQLRAVLAADARLRTIVGPGGIGKTTLARRLAALIGASGLPVVFCELSEASSLSDAKRMIGTAVGGRGELVERLRRRGELLLVLDNVEQLVHLTMPQQIGTWLAEAPWLQVLVTSRVVLGLADEWVLWLEGLSTSDAARLFVQRMPRATAIDEGDVRAIVDRLEGLPLAIELAAGRTLVLSTSEILARLAQGSDWLASPAGGRHGSLGRIVDDSWNLLTPVQKDALTASLVFGAPFPASAFEAVFARPEALDALDSLVRASLLERLPDTPSFRTQVPVREVLAPRLARHRCAATWRERHAYWFSRLAAAGPPDARHLTDLRSAAAWSIAHDRADDGLVLAVEELLTSEGAVRDALALVEAALVVSSSTRLLLARARAFRTLGRIDLARADAERVASDADGPLAATACVELAELADHDGDLVTAMAHLDRATVLLGSASGRVFAELRLRQAHIWRRELRLVLASEGVSDAMTTFAALRLHERLALAHYERGVIALLRRDLVAAEADFEDALKLTVAERAASAEALVRAGRAIVWQEQGRFEEAITEYAHAARLNHDIGYVYREGSALYYLGTAYLEIGELDQAARTFDEALTLVNEVNVPRYVALIEGARSLIHAARGATQSAADSLARAREAFARCAREHQLDRALACYEGRDTQDAHDETDDIRFARRMSAARREGRWPPVPGDVLIVGASGFRLPGAPSEVSLAGRPVLSRILRLLADRRVTTPGRVVPFEALREAAWPEERMTPDSARNRMHVAMATLRKLGLRPWLLRDAGGYMLSPAQAFRTDTV